MSHMSTRGLFAGWLNEKGLLGTAVEVGTHRAEFAAGFRHIWEGRLLLCVDPWTVPPGYAPQAGLLEHGDGDRRRDMRAARDALLKCARAWELVRATSVEAAPMVPDGSADFVYIDGDHRREMVLQDLRLWWPKLRPGGVLAGHDWVQPGEVTGWAGEVQSALAEFVAPLGLDVYLIVEEGGLPWSWYVEKK